MKRVTILLFATTLALSLSLPAFAKKGRDKGVSSVAVTNGSADCVNGPKEDNLLSEAEGLLVWITLSPLVTLDELVWSLFNRGDLVADGDEFDEQCSTGNRHLVELSDLDTEDLTTKDNGKPESYTLVIDLDTGENYGADSFRWSTP